MTLCIGVDPSSKKMAVVCELDGEFYFDYVSSVAKHLPDRVWQLAAGTGEFIDSITAFDLVVDPQDVYIYIEEPVVARNARATIVQAQAQGALMAELYGYNIYQVNNKTWKKEVVGNGNASKDQVASWLAEHHPDLYKQIKQDQDLIDAAAICIYARAKSELSERIRLGISGVDVA